MVVVGGVIPPEDFDELRAAGADAIFPPGTVIGEAAARPASSCCSSASVTTEAPKHAAQA